MSIPEDGKLDAATLDVWERWLRAVVGQTGAMVEMAVWLGDARLAASWARQGVTAARLLGWWRERTDVPAEAFGPGAGEGRG